MAIREGRVSARRSFLVIKVRRFNRTIRSMIKFNKETEKIAKKAFNKMLLEVKREIKKEAPKNTGLLRKSIKILENKNTKKEGFVGIIGPDGSAVNKQGKHYVPLILFGTFRNRPNNFMKRGFKNAQPEIKQLIRKMGRDIRAAVKRSKS